mgnify:CR=1 FL=1
MNRERRKALQAIVDQLETLQMQLEEIQTEEEEYRDNIPENFQSGEKQSHRQILQRSRNVPRKSVKACPMR